MNVVVVGGHSRNVGKTSVMAGLIRSLSPPLWTAVKITQYGHGVCSLDGKPCGCEPREHAFVLTEEKNPQGRADTCRFLAAGARRSLWLRVRQGQLDRAFPTLLRALTRDSWVMMESNSVLGFLDPALYLFVLDPSHQDFKASARSYLRRADALVPLDPLQAGNPWPEIESSLLTSKPRFQVTRPGCRSAALEQFVRQRLDLPSQ